LQNKPEVKDFFVEFVEKKPIVIMERSTISENKRPKNALFHFLWLEDVIPEKLMPRRLHRSNAFPFIRTLVEPLEKRPSFHRSRGRFSGDGAELPL
jgi:hypothetical protein